MDKFHKILNENRDNYRLWYPGSRCYNVKIDIEEELSRYKGIDTFIEQMCQRWGFVLERECSKWKAYIPPLEDGKERTWAQQELMIYASLIEEDRKRQEEFAEQDVKLMFKIMGEMDKVYVDKTKEGIKFSVHSKYFEYSNPYYQRRVEQLIAKEGFTEIKFYSNFNSWDFFLPKAIIEEMKRES